MAAHLALKQRTLRVDFVRSSQGIRQGRTDPTQSKACTHKRARLHHVQVIMLLEISKLFRVHVLLPWFGVVANLFGKSFFPEVL